MPNEECPRRQCCRPGGPRRRGRGSLLEPAVLAVLESEQAHGYDVRKAIEEMTGGHLTADAGGVYRCLRRMEDEGLVTSAWAEGDAGPQRREYLLTAEGSVRLAEWLDDLRERESALHALTEAVARAVQHHPEKHDLTTKGCDDV